MDNNIVTMPIKDIHPYEGNPRINDDAVEAVAASIREFGFRNPIIVDKDMVIIAGHTRYKAAKSMKMKEVPVIVADDLSDEQVRAYRLADNKTGELAEWNFDMLDSELAEIADIDMSQFGFDPSEIEDALTNSGEIVEDDFDAEPPEEPVTKRGDIYRLGDHILMCGDSTLEADVSKLMQGEKADMVFTDPPYGMNAVSKSGVLSKTYGSDIMNDDSNEVAIAAFKLSQSTFPNAKHVWWGANYYTECLPSAECWIVWDKNNGMSDQTDCELAWTNFRSVVRQFTLASEKTNRVHPTQKPIKLIGEIFNRFDSKKEIKSILDLFGGSGSTLIACEQTGRRCRMMELDPHYCDVIVRRWEEFTGKKAELVEEGEHD